MKLIFRYMGKYKGAIFLAIFIKLIGTMSELTLPYILEYMIDTVVPTKNLGQVILWGLFMFAASIFCRQFNVMANRKAIYNAHKVSYDVRGDLFKKTANLSGDKFDEFSLPSLISRMTSDSYNVQSAVQQLQSLCVRAPIMLFGGVVMTLFMDFHLAMILIIMLPFLIGIVLIVSSKGIPMYTKVQQKLDTVRKSNRGSGQCEETGADHQENKPQGVECSLHESLPCNAYDPEFHPYGFPGCKEKIQQKGNNDNQPKRL